MVRKDISWPICFIFYEIKEYIQVKREKLMNIRVIGYEKVNEPDVIVVHSIRVFPVH